jgi:hypothetical protein
LEQVMLVTRKGPEAFVRADQLDNPVVVQVNLQRLSRRSDFKRYQFRRHASNVSMRGAHH